MAGKYTFVLIHGQHREADVTLNEGTKVTSDLELDKIHPNKFKRLAGGKKGRKSDEMEFEDDFVTEDARLSAEEPDPDERAEALREAAELAEEEAEKKGEKKPLRRTLEVVEEDDTPAKKKAAASRQHHAPNTGQPPVGEEGEPKPKKKAPKKQEEDEGEEDEDVTDKFESVGDSGLTVVKRKGEGYFLKKGRKEVGGPFKKKMEVDQAVEEHVGG